MINDVDNEENKKAKRVNKKDHDVLFNKKVIRDIK